MSYAAAVAHHCNEVLAAVGCPARAMPVAGDAIAFFVLPDDLEGQTEITTNARIANLDDAAWIAHRVAELHAGGRSWRKAKWS